MRIKTKRLLGILISLVMVLGLMPGMSLTALAAVTYTKDSEGIADGVILINPGDTIDTSNTNEKLIFDSLTTVGDSNGARTFTCEVNRQWREVHSFYINDNNEFICYNYSSNSKFIPENGKAFKVSYDAANDYWHIVQVDAPVTNYPLYVSGTQVTSANATDTEHPTWSYVAETNTLTLNDYTFNGSENGINYTGTDELNVVLTGTNTITSSGGNGIRGTGALKLLGTGSLTAKGQSFGAIYTSGDITIESGIITAEGDISAIRSESGDITVSGGTVTTTGNFSLFAGNNITISGGTVNATGSSAGIEAKTIEIKNGSVTATGTSDFSSLGIYAFDGDVKITNGTVSATGTTGIKAFNGDVTISSGTVEATGSKGNGIEATSSGTRGCVWISGGNATIIGNKSTEEHSAPAYGIYASGCVKIGSVVNNVVIAGTSNAINAKTGENGVINELAGTGWTDMEGNTGKAGIEISSGGQTLNYKRVQFPTVLDPSTIIKVPTAKSLTYTGSAQALVSEGEASGGQIQYALGTNSTTAPETGWGSSIPEGTDAKTYYVWYKVVGDADHSDIAPACITVTISRAKYQNNTAADSTIEYSNEEKALITPGEASGGTMVYAVVRDENAKPDEGAYSEAIPTGREVGTYYVWYKVKGDANHSDSDPERIIVKIFELKADTKTILPEDKKSSVTANATTTGLEEEVQNANTGDERVELKLNVASQGEEKATESATLKNDAQMSNSVKNQYIDESSVAVEVLDIDIEKLITNSGVTSSSLVPKTNNVLEIAIPYNFTEKYDLRIVRRHGDSVQVFTPLSERATADPRDGTFFVDRDNNILYVYSQFFSTYVVAYSTVEGNARQVVAASGSAGSSSEPTTVPVYRLYNKLTGAHFYTANKAERDLLLNQNSNAGWTDEGVAFQTAVTSGTPVYRVFDLKNGIHFYTADVATRDAYIASGCRDEGIAWYALTKTGRTVYKATNPSNGRILYTISKAEVDALANAGFTCDNAEFVVY